MQQRVYSYRFIYSFISYVSWCFVGSRAWSNKGGKGRKIIAWARVKNEIQLLLGPQKKKSNFWSSHCVFWKQLQLLPAPCLPMTTFPSLLICFFSFTLLLHLQHPPPPPISLLDVPLHSRCTQTAPGFTWRQTVTHVIKWTRDYLFGVHQSSREFKDVTKSSKTPLKVEPRGVVWSILRMSGYTPLDTVADELVPSVHVKSHLQASSNNGDGIEYLNQSSVSEKSWRPPKITHHPGKGITSEWIVWPPQTRPGEVGWIEQDLICERSG